METFNSKLKKEICSLNPKSQELMISRLSGIIKSSGVIKKNLKGIEILITTELLETYNCIEFLVSNLYGVSVSLEISNKVGYNNKTKYEISFPQEITKKLLLDTEIAFYDDEKYFCINDGISKYIVEEKDQIVEYIKGVYISCGTSNIVLSNTETDKINNSNYQLEFVLQSENYAIEFMELLAGIGIITKGVNRKEYYVVYVQNFDEVSSLIGLMGATNSFLDLQNESAIRELRNNLNRQNNCFSGNITKQVNASIKQLEDIELIQNTIGIENLDSSLQQVCYLRLANPEESLDNLVKLSTQNISKSGLYHRFQKISKIAKDVK